MSHKLCSWMTLKKAINWVQNAKTAFVFHVFFCIISKKTKQTNMFF